MQYNDFIKLTKSSEPSDELKGIHLSLWYAVKDDWDLAHNIVQDINSETASRIHAYLHRVEGDIGNAHYWYDRAGIEPYSRSLESELDHIIRSVFI